MAVILTLAIVPLGSVALYAEYFSWTTQIESNRSQLITRTIDTTTGQSALLFSATQNSISLVPNIVALRDDPAACSAFLRDFISEASFYAFAGFIGADGIMACVSQGDVVDFSERGEFQAELIPTKPYFRFQEAGRVTGLPVVLVNRPIYDSEGFLGVLTISIANTTLAMIATQPDPSADLQFAYLVNDLGDTLTYSENPDASDRLPETADLRRFISEREGVFPGTSVSGAERVFTTATLIPGQLYALGSWSPDHVRGLLMPHYGRLILPVAMWIASVGVLMLSIHYLVVRHLKQLNTQLRRFALGNRDDLIRLPADAPTELREIDSTFSKMARLIRRDETELEDALREKTVLLKEVHHRVKNNLQLIASILNLQMRRLKDPDAKLILKGVQARVRALASIHRALYEETRVSNIDATAFLDSILKDTLSLVRADRSKLNIETDFDAVSLPADKIIPLAMLFAEALTNALKYATPAEDGKYPLIKASIRASGGTVEMRVRNDISAEEAESRDTGLGRELMTAFALQIGADLEAGPALGKDGRTVWEIRLRIDDGGLNRDAEDHPILSA
ncbi:sensor histidine kinase [Yoonia sp.]|uniref:sensor histidine kinase n=1 Tax=Yoonia sp. TaxID=2212373 RepID=UPI00391BF370